MASAETLNCDIVAFLCSMTMTFDRNSKSTEYNTVPVKFDNALPHKKFNKLNVDLITA